MNSECLPKSTTFSPTDRLGNQKVTEECVLNMSMVE